MAASTAILPPPPSIVLPPFTPLPRGGVLTPSQRRSAFAAAAAAAEAATSRPASSMREGEQRTAEWRALRDARLTASAFGNAIGFWGGGRSKLWREKVGLAKPFAGNAATRYGTKAEPAALEAYAAATGACVDECRFEVLLDDDAHGWLGASPDGLLRLEGVGRGGGTTTTPRTAVLEIKCPFNRGAPAAAVPWPVPPAYYMPQVQGLLAVLGGRRLADGGHLPPDDFCDLWCWTPRHGAASYRIPIDRGYWAAAYEVLADFWWVHVVPARHAVAEAAVRGGDAAAAAAPFEPPEAHPLTDALKARSEAMAAGSRVVRFGVDALPGVDVEGLVDGGGG